MIFVSVNEQSGKVESSVESYTEAAELEGMMPFTVEGVDVFQTTKYAYNFDTNEFYFVGDPPSSYHIFVSGAWQESTDLAKQVALVELKNNYYMVTGGKDPATGKNMYIDCVVGETTYRMDAGRHAAESMDEGIRIFERMGSPVMPKVRDFYNHNHLNVPLEIAVAIGVQQAADALNHWAAYGDRVDEIKAAQTVQELRDLESIPVFDINTLPE